jgi:ornithine decarboxylase
MQLIDHQARLQLPSHWPVPLRPEALNQLEHPTLFLVCDLETVRERYVRLLAALPEVRCFYAIKCNGSTELLAAFAALGSSFEVASYTELQTLQALGVDPAEVLYSNTVKPASHVARSFAAGLWRFAFDSEGELYKLAEHAPGSAVFVRLRVDDSTSLFPLSRKFGAEAQEARALLLLARNLGLRPYGVTFHVGSQCTTASAWRQAIAAVGRLLDRLSGDGITLEMVNLGAASRPAMSSRCPRSTRSPTPSSRRCTSCSPTRQGCWRWSPGATWSPRARCWSVACSAARSGRVRTGRTWTSAPTTVSWRPSRRSMSGATRCGARAPTMPPTRCRSP